jgi:amino acid transporter
MWVVVASIGGPLTITALYTPDIAPTGLTIVLGILVVLAPLSIWLGFSERIASSGGLAAFVDAAAGRTTARIFAGVWIVSYFLYLPYTVTYIVYDILAPVFPGIHPYRSALELVIPVAICLLIFVSLNTSAWILAVVGVTQLVFVAVLGGILFMHGGASSSSFTADVGSVPLAKSVGAVALLFTCATLPLFFGDEVEGGTRTIHRGLKWGVGIAALFIAIVFVPFATGAGRFFDAGMPGVAIARAYGGRPLEVVVALFLAASTAALIVLELLALGRLAHWLGGWSIRSSLAVFAVPFVLADVISLVNPDKFYNDLAPVSGVALFVSQIIVFVVYPLYRRRQPERLPRALAAATIATALAGYGLYLAFNAVDVT